MDLAPDIMDDDATIDAEEVERDFQKVHVATTPSADRVEFTRASRSFPVPKAASFLPMSAATVLASVPELAARRAAPRGRSSSLARP